MYRKKPATAFAAAAVSGDKLLKAVEAGNTKEIFSLLKTGVDPNYADAAGRTPMSVAVDHKNWYIAQLLLEAGSTPPHYDGDPNGPVKYEGINTAIRQEIEHETALTYYIKKANWYDPIFRVISNGADINLPNKAERTPLQISVDRSWPYVSVQLVKHGAWLNAQKPDPDEVVDKATGATRLLAVIMEGQDAYAVEKILKEGADPNKTDRTSLAPLALARMLNWPYVEKLLMAHGAKEAAALPDPNTLVGGKNDTPLLCYAASAQCCHGGYKQALLDAGANPNATDNDGMAPIHRAALHGDEWFFDALVEAGADMFMPNNKTGITPLQLACLNNHASIAAKILNTQPPVLIQDVHQETGDTLLHWAAGREGSVQLLKILTDRGAFINIRNKHGETPLHKAVGTHDPEMVRFLLENGADLDKANDGKRYNPPLFSLVNTHHKNNLAITQLLLRHGADPNIRATESISGPQKGDSLLYFAVSYMAYDMARELLKAGADPHDTSHCGESAMHHCLELRQMEGVKLLLEHGFDVHQHYECTQQWSSGPHHYADSAYERAKELVQKFGHDREYGQMLDMIEEHIAQKKDAVMPASKPFRIPKK